MSITPTPGADSRAGKGVFSTREALAFVREHGVVLVSAKGNGPNLVEAIAGEPIKGSWWGHRAGKPLFAPSTRATVAVGVVLLLFAGLVAATGRLLEVGVSPRLLSWLSLALALGLLARAIGEFKYVGFFKRVRGSRFAHLDTWIYSPLCLLLALGVALVAMRNGV